MRKKWVEWKENERDPIQKREVPDFDSDEARIELIKEE